MNYGDPVTYHAWRKYHHEQLIKDGKIPRSGSNEVNAGEDAADDAKKEIEARQVHAGSF